MLLFFHLYCTELLENGLDGQKHTRGNLKEVGHPQRRCTRLVLISVIPRRHCEQYRTDPESMGEQSLLRVYLVRIEWIWLAGCQLAHPVYCIIVLVWLPTSQGVCSS